MKRIKNTTIDNPFNGRPIEVTHDFRRDAAGQIIRDEKTGEPLYPITTSQTTALAVRTFIANIPSKDGTMDDAHKAVRILDALRPFKLLEKIDPDYVVPTSIVLEDAEYDWLKSKYQTYGVQVHGVAFAAVYLRAIEDVEKPEERAPTIVKRSLTGAKA